MATVLYITAHPGDTAHSYSLAVGEQFVEAYREANPGDEIVHIDLFKEDIPQIDAIVFGAWGKLQSGVSFDQLSGEEQAKVGKLGQLADQFVAADKYVFVNPMWNFSYPPVLKAYIDSICVAGKTFKYTEQGPVGLLSGKKALHIQASGGVYSQGPAQEIEAGSRHLKSVLGFIGVAEFEKLFVEGMAFTPDQAADIKAKAIDKAIEIAKGF